MATFNQLVDNLPSEHKSVQTVAKTRWWNGTVGECFFGVPSDFSFGRDELDKLPADASAFNFCLGTEHTDLLTAYIESEYPAQTTTLSIGTSTELFDSGFYRDGMNDFREQIDILSRASFPRLRVIIKLLVMVVTSAWIVILS